MNTPWSRSPIVPCALLLAASAVSAGEPEYPDVASWYPDKFGNKFFDGTIAAGPRALQYWMRVQSYRRNWRHPDNTKKIDIEKLWLGDPEHVQKVNEQILKKCRGYLSNFDSRPGQRRRLRPPPQVPARRQDPRDEVALLQRGV